MNGTAVLQMPSFEVGENGEQRIVGMGCVDVIDLTNRGNGLLAKGFERVVVEQVGVGFEVNLAVGGRNSPVDVEEARRGEATAATCVLGVRIGEGDPDFVDLAGREVGLEVFDLNAEKANVVQRFGEGDFGTYPKPGPLNVDTNNIDVGISAREFECVMAFPACEFEDDRVIIAENRRSPLAFWGMGVLEVGELENVGKVLNIGVALTLVFLGHSYPSVSQNTPARCLASI